MKKLIIKKTPKTPDIQFDPNGNLEISGVSVPENSMAFYKPIIDWTEQYAKTTTTKTVLDFKLEYINTSSLQFIYDILILLANIKNSNQLVKVNWHYTEEDIDMKETGEDYNETVNIPFNFIEIPED